MDGERRNYISYQIEDKLCGRMQDDELNELAEDIKCLTYYMDENTKDIADKEGYFKAVADFKKKWFGGERSERLKKYIDKHFRQLHGKLYQLIGEPTEVE